MSSYAPLGRQGKLKSQGMSRDLFGSRTKHLSKSKLPRCCFAHKPRYPEGLRPFGAKNLHACVFFARRAKCSHTRWHASCISNIRANRLGTILAKQVSNKRKAGLLNIGPCHKDMVHTIQQACFPEVTSCY